MRTYLYTVKSIVKSRQKKNREITVYRIVKNKPRFVGSEQVNTAAYKGDVTTAKEIISEIDGIKMKDGYDLVTEIDLIQI